MVIQKVPPDQLLPSLYGALTDQHNWSPFLTQLAGLFNTGTATLRLLDTRATLAYQSYTVGFSEEATHNYLQTFISSDPFRETLNDLAVGQVAASHQIIADEDYEQTGHYQHVFKPNGNFYAMGSQVERTATRTLQIGIHRPREAGPFLKADCELLHYFTPHLHQAGKLLTLLDEYRHALQSCHLALNQLPFCIWELDEHFRSLWMNPAAVQALESGLYTLTTRAGRLTFKDNQNATLLLRAQQQLHQGEQPAQVLRISEGRAALVLVATQIQEQMQTREKSCHYLAFLLDSERPLTISLQKLQLFYQLTPAEARLLNYFLQGLDLQEISLLLQVSLHTVRSQFKSILRKTETTRQSELMRKLLLTLGGLTQVDQ